MQNNLVFYNGAGGIQQWGNHRVDLVNNTVAYNGTNLPWGQVAFERAVDTRLVNNVVASSETVPLDRWFHNRDDKEAHQIRGEFNLFFGGSAPPIAGLETLVADPLCVNPVAEPAQADYRVQRQSPAIGSGTSETFTPTCDLFGNPRPTDRPIDRGAIQHID